MVSTKLANKDEPLIKPVVRFYLAEDLRQEINGKVSAIGLYPDNAVLLPIPDEIPEPSESAPILFKSLGFLFNVSKLIQASVISVDIESDGKRRPFMKPQEHPAPGDGKSVNLLGVLAPCQVTSFGEKTLFVTVGESVHTFTFEIRRVSLPAKVTDSDLQIEELKIPRRTLAVKAKRTKEK